jgi:hypothetical protein
MSHCPAPSPSDLKGLQARSSRYETMLIADVISNLHFLALAFAAASFAYRELRMVFCGTTHANEVPAPAGSFTMGPNSPGRLRLFLIGRFHGTIHHIYTQIIRSTLHFGSSNEHIHRLIRSVILCPERHVLIIRIRRRVIRVRFGVEVGLLCLGLGLGLGIRLLWV